MKKGTKPINFERRCLYNAIYGALENRGKLVKKGRFAAMAGPKPSPDDGIEPTPSDG